MAASTETEHASDGGSMVSRPADSSPLHHMTGNGLNGIPPIRTTSSASQNGMHASGSFSGQAQAGQCGAAAAGDASSGEPSAAPPSPGAFMQQDPPHHPSFLANMHASHAFSMGAFGGGQQAGPQTGRPALQPLQLPGGQPAPLSAQSGLVSPQAFTPGHAGAQQAPGTPQDHASKSDTLVFERMMADMKAAAGGTLNEEQMQALLSVVQRHLAPAGPASGGAASPAAMQQEAQAGGMGGAAPSLGVPGSWQHVDWSPGPSPHAGLTPATNIWANRPATDPGTSALTLPGDHAMLGGLGGAASVTGGLPTTGGIPSRMNAVGGLGGAAPTGHTPSLAEVAAMLNIHGAPQPATPRSLADPLASGASNLSGEPALASGSSAGDDEMRVQQGPAQVAVHNVPFKWAHCELEALFSGQPGFKDAVLLFHDNGRSKGVGVALFETRGMAQEAVAALSGRRVDGRQLELAVLSEDNHISFDTKQVCILGLPWEYTSKDVRALLEGAGHVENVQVLYRPDGKSEGRAIAAFATREGARRAVLRLNNRETLTGLHLRLFHAQEPARARRRRLAGQESLGLFDPATGTPITATPRSSFEGTGGASSVEAGVAEHEEEALVGLDDEDKGPTILHVSGLPEGVSREELRALFSTAGEVTKVDIPNGGRNLGYGFVTFNSSKAAEQAMLQLNNYPLQGGAIHVAYSTSATARVRQQALQQAKARATHMAAYAAGVIDSPTRPRLPGAASPLAGFPGHLAGAGGLWPQTPGSLASRTSFTPSPVGYASAPGSGANTPRHAAFGPEGALPPTGAGVMRRGALDFAGSGIGGQAMGRRSFDVPSGAQDLLAARRLSVDVAGPAFTGSFGGGVSQALAGAFGGFGTQQGQTMGFGTGLGMGLGLPPVAPSTTGHQVYISGLPAAMTQEQLHNMFAALGEVEYVRKMVGREYGFVRLRHPEAAAQAVQLLNGNVLPSGHVLRCELSSSLIDRSQQAPAGLHSWQSFDSGTAMMLAQQAQHAGAADQGVAGIGPGGGLLATLSADQSVLSQLAAEMAAGGGGGTFGAGAGGDIWGFGAGGDASMSPGALGGPGAFGGAAAMKPPMAPMTGGRRSPGLWGGSTTAGMLGGAGLDHLLPGGARFGDQMGFGAAQPQANDPVWQALFNAANANQQESEGGGAAAPASAAGSEPTGGTPRSAHSGGLAAGAAEAEEAMHTSAAMLPDSLLG